MSDFKAQLTMTSGPVPGSSYYLEKSEYFIGRDLANDIPIPEVEISRRHARIFLQGNLVFIEDLGSTNGTFVNGTRISSPKELHQGDVITLAESTKFSFSQSGQAVSTPVLQTNPMSSYTQPSPQPQPSYQAVAAPVPQRELAPEPTYTKPKKKPSGFLVFLLILVIILLLAGLVLVFMPSSWWCVITFNGLPGCPVR